MKLLRLIVISLVALALSTVAFAHGGHKHQILGTVKALNAQQLVVTTVEKSEVTFTLTGETTFTKGSASATRDDLVEGVRVSVYVQNDGKTVTSVKIAK